MKQNWRAIGEITAVLSVILSLIYVGFEIRQSSNIARSEAYSEYANRINDMSLIIAQNEQLAELVGRVNQGAGSDDFNLAELSMLGYLMAAAVRAQEGLWRAVQADVVPAEGLEYVGAANLQNNELFRLYLWPSIRVLHDPDFVEFYETREWNK